MGNDTISIHSKKKKKKWPGWGSMPAQLLSPVWLFAIPWTVARQAPYPWDFSQQEYWKWQPISSSRGSSWPRDRNCVSCVSCIAARFLIAEPRGKNKRLHSNLTQWWRSTWTSKESGPMYNVRWINRQKAESIFQNLYVMLYISITPYIRD